MARKNQKDIEVIGDDSAALDSHLYAACGILRGPVQADEYKIYLFPLMFLKRISDVYDEETQEAIDAGGDEEYAALPENHRFQIPDGYHWNDIRECVENVGDKIQTSMRKIEAANPNKLYGIFSDFDEASWTNKNKLTDERLKNLIEHFSQINLGNKAIEADVMGQAYEMLIKRFADMTKESAGEFYTPRAVIRLMIRILDPKPGETIYDPACGTGGMLIESMKHMKDARLSFGKLYGQEKNLSTASIARMNIFLHGGDDFFIERGDTLKEPKFLVGDRLRTFDCVVANPPFSLKPWSYELWKADPYQRTMFGLPPENNGDFAWIQHMVKSMDPENGRMAVVLPQGVLFKKDVKELRKKMIESRKLFAIVQMGDKLFYGTGLSPCILFLSNKEPAETITFVDASGIYKKGIGQNYLMDGHIDEIYSAITGTEDIEGVSKIVRYEDLDKETSDLSVNRYVKKTIVDTTPPFEEVLKTLTSSFERSAKLEEEIKALIKEGGYLDE